MTKHKDFIDINLPTFLKSFPKAKEISEYIVKLMNETDKNLTTDLYAGKQYDMYFRYVLFRLEYQFALQHPKQYMKIHKWSSQPEFILSDNIVIDILKINSVNKYIKYFVDKIKIDLIKVSKLTFVIK